MSYSQATIASLQISYVLEPLRRLGEMCGPTSAARALGTESTP